MSLERLIEETVERAVERAIAKHLAAPPVADQLLSIAQVADRIGWHPVTVAKVLIKAGDGPLPSLLVGGSRRIREADLQAFIDAGLAQQRQLQLVDGVGA